MHLLSEWTAVSFKFCERVSVDLGIQHATRIRHIIICGLPAIQYFPHYLIAAQFSK